MATINLVCTSDARIAKTGSTEYGSGGSDALPFGLWSGYVYRSLMKFQGIPAGTTSITKAVLKVRNTTQVNVGFGSSPSGYVQRITGSWSAGSAASLSTSNAVIYPGPTTTSTNQKAFTFNRTENAWQSVDITALMRDALASGWTGLRLVATSESAAADVGEVWAEDKGTSYRAYIELTYETTSPPTTPTLNSPASGQWLADDTPTLSWTFTGKGPQTGATVQIATDGGFANVIHSLDVPDASASIDAPALARGGVYYWRVQTRSADGTSPWSITYSFGIVSPSGVSISSASVVFQNGAPRLRVTWSTSSQSAYRLLAVNIGDTGWQNDTTTRESNWGSQDISYANGTPTDITIWVRDANGLESSATVQFTPRWGLTTHRRDLGAAPLSWGNPLLVSTTPGGGNLTIEYGSGNSGANDPESGWRSSLGACPVGRYVYWRAWFLPAGGVSPVLDRLTLSGSNTVQSLDHWFTLGQNGMTAPWSVDASEFVYGSRSARKDCDGNWPGLRSEPIPLRAGRSYILTGLMKSEGASEANIMLLNPANNNGLQNSAGETIQTEKLLATRDWFRPDGNDTYRYRTPVFVAPSDMEVYAYLQANGPSGTRAWFDAVKLEESTVATPWSPGTVGASIVDAGGVQIDGSRGGLFRYRGRNGGVRDIVEGGAKGLVFGGDTEVSSPSSGLLMVGARNLETRSRMGNLFNGDFYHGMQGWIASFPQAHAEGLVGNPGAWVGQDWPGAQVLSVNTGAADGNQLLQHEDFIPVVPGEPIEVSFVAAHISGNTGDLSVYAISLDESGQELDWPYKNVQVGPTAKRFRVAISARDTMHFLKLRFVPRVPNAWLAFGDIQVNRVNTPQIIRSGRGVIAPNGGFVTVGLGYLFKDPPAIIAVPEYDGSAGAGWMYTNTQMNPMNGVYQTANLYVRKMDGSIPSIEVRVAWTAMGDR